MRKLLILLWFLWLTVGVWAQTTSPSASIRFGPTLPSTCNPSGPNVFFKTSATVGLYQCLTLNNWTAVGSGESSGITIGTTTITSGTTTRVLFDNAGVVGEYSISGTGNVAMTTTPTIATPSFTTGFTIGGTATSRKIMVGNGTNFVPSTETYAVPGTSGNVLTSDGTNWTSAAAAGGGLTTGTTTIASGANTKVLFNNSGVLGEYTITGSTNVVMSASPTLTGTVGLAAMTASGTIVQTSASATAFESGPNGSTNPVFRLINNIASQADGVSVTGLAAGSGTTFTALSSGSNAGFLFTPKGTSGVGILGAAPASTRFRVHVATDFNLDVAQFSSTDVAIQALNDVQSAFVPLMIGTNGANFRAGATPNIRLDTGNGWVLGASGVLYGWVSSSTDARTFPDTTIGRDSAGVVTIGNNLLAGRVVTAKTSDFTVTTAGKSTYFTNSGAAGAVVFTLPTAAVGLPYTVCRDANFLVTVVAGASTTIRVGASVTAAAGNVTLDAVGSCIHLQAISTTQWFGMIVGAVTFN